MPQAARLSNPILIVACIAIPVSFAVRAPLGVFQIPITAEFGWPGIDFLLTIAIRDLAWGIGQPSCAAIAENAEDRKAIVLGALTYAAGMILSAWSATRHSAT